MARPILIALLCLTACEGEISIPSPAAHDPFNPNAPPPPPPVKVSACTSEVKPGAAPVRRMTRVEYDRTVRDLLNDDTRPGTDFSAEEEVLGFNNNAAALVTSSALVDKQLAAAEGIADRAIAKLSTLAWFQCDPAAQGAQLCADQFVEGFGYRAYRRPLTTDERAALQALYTRGAAIGALDAANQPLPAFVAGVKLVIEGVLLSPDFLYRLEMLPQSAGITAVVEGPTRLDGYAVASRLSYLLWASMPDDVLLEAAAKGELVLPEQIAAQTRRMLQDPRARAVVAEFHEQWLDFSRVNNAGKAASVFPDWSPTIAAAMQQETSAFIEHVVFDDDGRWDTLMAAPYSMMNRTLTRFYGLGEGPETGFAKISLDLEQRAGLLTQGSLLAINAHSNQTSPVHRGKLVREAYLCEVLPAPPADVNITVPEPKADSTARERFAQHSSNLSCSGCHKLMDPLGFGFENFDGVGKWRDTEAMKPIDASGQVNGTDVSGPYVGARELANKLVQSQQARNCYVKQWFRFGYGRGEQPVDACTLERLQTAFETSGHSIPSLIEALTQSDAFLYRGALP